MVELILASGSESRRTTLQNAGLSIKAIAPQIDEAAHKLSMRAANIPISDQAMHLAELKAIKVSQTREGLVLAGDQMLNLSGEALDKPADLEMAKSHLRKLSGRTHHLETAIVLAERGRIVWRYLARPKLTVRPLSEDFIEAYIAQSGEDLCKTVGAYKLEAEGVQLFTRIEGDFFSVLGLPLLPLLDYLRSRGMLPS